MSIHFILRNDSEGQEYAASFVEEPEKLTKDEVYDLFKKVLSQLQNESN